LFAALAFLLFATRAHGQLDRRSLAEEVRKGIDDHSIHIDPPKMDYDESRKTLTYNLGGRRRGLTEGRTALQFPTDLQISIELIRKYRANQLAFWQPYLQKVEAIVAEDLGLVARFQGTQEQLLGKLAENDQKALDIFMDAVHTSAKNKGMTASALAQGAGVWTVSLKPQPQNAKIYYLNRFDYSIALKAGKEKKITSWNQAANASIGLANGNYYFYAVWPDGKSTITATVPITSDQTVNLSPD
jgi:hypothetical protein